MKDSIFASRPIPGLSKELRKFLRFFRWEGVLFTFYDTWTNSTYLSALAGEFSVPLGLVSILAAVPWIGSIGQIFGAWAFERVSSVKIYVIAIAAFGRSLWLLPLVLAVFFAFRVDRIGVPFPVLGWFVLLTVCACVSSFFTSASANVWMYWMRELIPSRFQGRFFGNRQQVTALTFTFASLMAVGLLKWNPSGYKVGASLLCFLALLSGLISVTMHFRIRDLPKRHPVSKQAKSVMDMIISPLRDKTFRRFLIFGAAFNGAVQLATSYFPYYFTKEMGFSLSEVALWTGMTNLGTFALSQFWGKHLDQRRSPYKMIWTVGHYISLSPLVYFFITERGWLKWVIPFEYFIYGIAWAGYLLAQTKLLFQLSPSSEGATYFSSYAAACGVMGALGSFIGGQLAAFFTQWGEFRLLWLTGFLARILVLWVLCRPHLKAELDYSRKN